MRLARVVLIAIAVAIASLAVPTSASRAAEVPVLPSGLVPHSPIAIDGNASFTSANGVVSGQGTAADPYVIAGWSISAPAAIGVQVRNTDAHAVFRDLVVVDAPVDAFYFYTVSNVSLVNVTAYANTGEGIRFESSRSISVAASNFTVNQAGVVMLNSADAVVRDSNFTANAGDGIVLTSSPNVTLERNAFAFNGFGGSGHGIELASTTGDVVLANRFTADGIFLTGSTLDAFDSHTITVDNLVSGLPILYLKDCNGRGVSGMDLGQLLLGGCSHARISNLTVSGGDVGIEIAFGTDAIIGPGVLVADSLSGIYIVQSSSVQVVDSQILDTGLGLQVDTSTDVRVSGMKISAPFPVTGESDGVVVTNSDRVNVTGNVIRHHRYAIALVDSGNVTLADNVAGLSGMGLNASTSRDLRVVGNLFTQDTSGMRLQGLVNGTFSGNGLRSILTTGANVSASSGLVFAHNVFGGSRDNAFDAQGGSDVWDGGYPAGGNFWGNYTGTDQFHGPTQNMPGADGLGDTPYRFDVNASDRYPLIVSPLLPDAPPDALFLVSPAIGNPLVTFRVTANLSSDLEDASSGLQVRWSWDDNASVTPWTTAKTAAHLYTAPGIHSIRLDVKDSAGLIDSWTTEVLVLPKPDGLPPQIVTTPPASAEVGQSIPITANISDSSGIANATLLYQGVDGGPFQSVPMQIETNGTNFTATIPAQPHAGTVAYVIVANDTWANEARAPVAGTSSVRIIDTFTPLLIGIVLAAVLLLAVAVAFFRFRRMRKRTPAEPPPEPPASPPNSP